MNLSFTVGFRARLSMSIAIFLWASGSPGPVRAQEPSDRTANFEELLTKMSSAPGNACNGKGEDFSRLEYYLFERADEAVEQGLNGAESAPSANGRAIGYRDRAIRALTALEHASAEINKEWDEENRFHFEVLDIPPALVVKMTYRNRATFTVFGIPYLSDDDKPNTAWRAIGAADDGRFEPRAGYDWVDLFPLWRGASNRARFLANFGDAGCGSGVGVFYYAYEWNPEDFGNLTEFIKLEGAASQEEPTDESDPGKEDLSSSFASIGKLQTTGTVITLPYCWFSQIDTWDNPSLCAVNSYDISQDQVRFLSQAINRPDLVPIAKAIEYGQAHDYPALLAYCASPEVALEILRNVPPFVYAGAALRVSQLDAVKETVEMGDDDVFHFEVEKREDRWLVVSFRIE
jgi:hypothetical protein